MGREFNQQRSDKHDDQHQRAGKSASAAATSISVDGLSHAQRSMLSAQQRVGNQAVLRRMKVQREDDASTAAATSSSPSADTSAAPGGDSQSLSAGGNSVTVDAGGVTISGGIVNIEAPMVRTAGVLQTDTIIANNVVGSNYTPGAGNVW